MKRLCILLCGVSVLMMGVMSAKAIDREAKMIDRVSLDLASLDDVDSIGGSILGESALSAGPEAWAILFGGGMGTISPIGEDDVDYWNVVLGLKLYLCPVTSISAVGRYEKYNMGSSDRSAKSAIFSAKQRLRPADAPFSPFVEGSITIRDRSTFTDPGTEDSFSEYLVSAGGGCEFAMNDELSFVFEAYYQLADSSDDGSEDLDGWLGSVSMVYYWQ